jgi:cytochrome c oxidase subunit II
MIVEIGARPSHKIRPSRGSCLNDRRKEVTIVKPVVFLAAVFLVGSLAAGGTESPRRIEIVAKRFTYEPNTITLKKGEPVVLVMRSADVTHGLKVDALNIESGDIKKDKDTEIQFTPQQTGHFVGQCAHFCGKGHGEMKLQLDVVE